MSTKTAYSFLLIILSIYSCRYKQPLTQIESADLQRFDTSVELTDEHILNMIAPYSKALSAEMDEVICYSKLPMEKARPQSFLGNFVCDLLLKAEYDVQPQLSFTNYGGLRAPLPEGKITVRHIYELMPFDNQVVLVKLSSKQWWDVIGNGIRRGGEPYASTNNMEIESPTKSGFLYKYDNMDSTGNDSFWVAVNDYIYNGGDGYQMLQEADSVIFTGKLIRDVLIEQCKRYTKENAYEPKLDKRLYRIQE